MSRIWDITTWRTFLKFQELFISPHVVKQILSVQQQLPLAFLLFLFGGGGGDEEPSVDKTLLVLVCQS